MSHNGFGIHIILETSVILSNSVPGLISERSPTTSSFRTESEDRTNVELTLIHANEVSPKLGPVKFDRRLDWLDTVHGQG